MSLIRWEPLREFESMFDRYSKAMHWPSSREQELLPTGDWLPNVDITEGDSELIINAEIPDVKKDDVKVSVENGVITIQGEKRQKNEEQNRKYHRVERTYGKFIRSFTLPTNVDESKIQATFSDGVLNLIIPKTEQDKQKAIEITVQ